MWHLYQYVLCEKKNNLYLPRSSGALLYFSRRLTAMASRRTLAAGYSFKTSHMSFLESTNRSLYPTERTDAVLLFPVSIMSQQVTQNKDIFNNCTTGYAVYNSTKSCGDLAWEGATLHQLGMQNQITTGTLACTTYVVFSVGTKVE